MNNLNKFILDEGMELTSGGLYRLDGTLYRTFSKLLGALQEAGLIERYHLVDLVMKSALEAEKTLKVAIRKVTKEKETKERQALLDSLPSFGHKPDVEKIQRDFVPCTIFNKSNRQDNRVILDKHTMENSLMAYDVYEKLVGKEYAKQMDAQNYILVPTYDPRSPGAFQPDENGLIKWNAYVTPKYFSLLPTVGNERPQIFTDFLNYFTDRDNLEIERLEFTLYEICFKLCPTYLILYGIPGIGKSLIFCQLAKNLIGPENATESKEDFGKNTFNAFINNKSLAILEEYPIRRSNKEFLKRIANEYIQIEEKHKKQETVKRHCNFILTLNDLGLIWVNPLDRRFNLVKTTTKGKISDVMGTDFWYKVKAAIEEPELLASYRNYLEKTYTKFRFEDTEQLPRNILYEQAVLDSFMPILKTELHALINGEVSELHYETLEGDHLRKNRNGKLNFYGRNTFVGYLRDFTWKGERILNVTHEGLVTLKNASTEAVEDLEILT